MLGAAVGTLAEVDVAHAPPRVDQVLRGPVLVAVRAPVGEVVVLRDRVAQPVALDRLPHVPRVPLERELGRVHADDGETVAAVAGVPGAERRQRPEAVDARVGPEVDQHDPAAQRPERERAVARRVPPALRVRDLGCRADHREALARVRAGGGLGDGAARVAAQVGEPLARGARLLDVLRRVHEDRRQVGGDPVLEADVELGDHHDRHDQEDDAHRLLECAAPARQRSGQPAAAQHERVEHDRAAGAVRERDGEPAGREVLRCRDRDDPGQNRARAGRVHEAEAEAEHEAGAEALALHARGRARDDPADPRLDPSRGARDDQHDARDRQHHDRERAEQLVRQAERREQVDERDRREGEGDDEAGYDSERAPPAAGGPGRKRHGQHREHARRQRGGGSGHEPEQDEKRHSAKDGSSPGALSRLSGR